MSVHLRLLKLEKRLGTPSTPGSGDKSDSAIYAWRRVQGRAVYECLLRLAKDKGPSWAIEFLRECVKSWCRQAGGFSDEEQAAMLASSMERDLDILREASQDGWWIKPNRDCITPLLLGEALADPRVFEQQPFESTTDYRLDGRVAFLIAWFSQKGPALQEFVREEADLSVVGFTHARVEECACAWCRLDLSNSFSARLRREYLKREKRESRGQ